MPIIVSLELLLSVAVLVALAAGGWWWSRCARSPRSSGVGHHVVVPVAHPVTALALSRLAVAVARSERGQVTPVTVVPVDATPDQRARAEQTLRTCEVAVADEGWIAEGRLRVDASVTDGVLGAAVEHGASLLVLGWPTGDERDFGAPVEELLRRSPVPVLLASLGGYRWERVVVRAGPGERGEAGDLADEVAGRLARQLDLEVEIAAPDEPLATSSPVHLEVRSAVAGSRLDLSAFAPQGGDADLVLAVAPPRQRPHREPSGSPRAGERPSSPPS